MDSPDVEDEPAVHVAEADEDFGVILMQIEPDLILPAQVDVIVHEFLPVDEFVEEGVLIRVHAEDGLDEFGGFVGDVAHYFLLIINLILSSSVQGRDEVGHRFELLIPVQLKSFPVLLPHIPTKQQRLQIALQEPEFVVFFPTVVGDDRNPIIPLKLVGVGEVVHQHHILQSPVQNPQVLHVEIVLQVDAILPVESVLN